MLPIRKTSELAVSKPFDISRCNIFDRDWYGNQLTTRCGFEICLTKNSLLFSAGAEIAPRTHPDDFTGRLIEGLWEYDVAELFLADASGRYFEINLSPTGAWWAAQFSKYRQRTDWRPGFAARTSSVITSREWSAQICIPIEDIPLETKKFENLRGNVCMIFGEIPRTFLSFDNRASGEPDFHLDQNFLPLGITQD